MTSNLQLDCDEKCPICLDKLDDGRTNGIYTIAECNHKFHSDCLIEWWKNGIMSCPLCRNEYNGVCNLKSKVSIFRKMGLRKGCPPLLKNLSKKLREAELEYKKSRGEYKKFKCNNKDILDEYIRLNKNIYLKHKNVISCEKELVSIPILSIPFGEVVRLPKF